MPSHWLNGQRTRERNPTYARERPAKLPSGGRVGESYYVAGSLSQNATVITFPPSYPIACSHCYVRNLFALLYFLLAMFTMLATYHPR